MLLTFSLVCAILSLHTFNRAWRLSHSLFSCLTSMRASSRSPSSRRTNEADAGVDFSWPLSLVISSLVYMQYTKNTIIEHSQDYLFIKYFEVVSVTSKILGIHLNLWSRDAIAAHKGLLPVIFPPALILFQNSWLPLSAHFSQLSAQHNPAAPMQQEGSYWSHAHVAPIVPLE